MGIPKKKEDNSSNYGIVDNNLNLKLRLKNGSNLVNTKDKLVFFIPNNEIFGWNEIVRFGRKRSYAEFNIYKFWQKSELKSKLNVRKPKLNAITGGLLTKEGKPKERGIIEDLCDSHVLSPSEISALTAHGIVKRGAVETTFTLHGFIDGDHRRLSIDEAVNNGYFDKSKEIALWVLDEETWDDNRLRESAIKRNTSKSPNQADLAEAAGFFDVFKKPMDDELWDIVANSSKSVKPVNIVTLLVSGNKQYDFPLTTFGSPKDALDIWKKDYGSVFSKTSKKYIKNALVLIDEFGIALSPILNKNELSKKYVGKNNRKAYFKKRVDGEFSIGGKLKKGNLAYVFAASVLRYSNFNEKTDSKKVAEKVSRNIGNGFFNATVPFSTMNLYARNGEAVSEIEKIVKKTFLRK